MGKMAEIAETKPKKNVQVRTEEKIETIKKFESAKTFETVN